MLRVDCGKKVIRKNNWLPICNHLNVNLIRYDIKAVLFTNKIKMPFTRSVVYF